MQSKPLVIDLNAEKKNLTSLNIGPFSTYAKKHYLLSTSEIISLNPDDRIMIKGDHPVFNSFVNAYKNDRPITISPDIIWLLIVQGFSNHVNFNSEQLRSKFVNFQGKKVLLVDKWNKSFEKNTKDDWKSIIERFINQTSKYIGNEIIDVLSPSFTTTTTESLIAGQLSIMCAVKKYFTYRVRGCSCCFPYITIEGIKEDWEKIYYKLDIIKEYDLEKWVSKLKPIIKKIIDSYEGNIDLEFWRNMIHIVDSMGIYYPGHIDGWFANFFLYSSSGNQLSGRISDKTRLTSEILKIPFEFEFDHKKNKCEFLTGFFGISQDPDTFSIKPEIGWAIRLVERVENPETEIQKDEKETYDDLAIEAIKAKSTEDKEWVSFDDIYLYIKRYIPENKSENCERMTHYTLDRLVNHSFLKMKKNSYSLNQEIPSITKVPKIEESKKIENNSE